MSEALRSRLCDWLRAHTDESAAECAMSCMSPVLLGDLVTKQHLETVLAVEFSAFAFTLAALREADREETAAEFAAVRAEAKHLFRWLVGAGVSVLGVAAWRSACSRSTHQAVHHPQRPFGHVAMRCSA